MFIQAKVAIKDSRKAVAPSVKLMLHEDLEKIPDTSTISFADVKKAYPDFADKLKALFFTSGNKITIKQLKAMLQEINPQDNKYWLSEKDWTQSVQTQLQQKQVVIQLNFTPAMVSEIKKFPAVVKYFTDRQEKYLRGHPLTNHTFAWARVYKFPDKWIIEEMQTDFVGWDKDLKSNTKNAEVYLATFSEKDQKIITDFLIKHFSKWEKQLLATIFSLARAEKVQNMYIFDVDQKQGQGTSPSKLKYYYEKLPKDMGFSRTTLNVGSKSLKTWHRAVASVFDQVASKYNVETIYYV